MMAEKKNGKELAKKGQKKNKEKQRLIKGRQQHL